MKARRFVGANSRAVLQQVRAELGQDAVILSNRTVPEGIEMLALASGAIDELVSDDAEGNGIAAAARPVAQSIAKAATSAGNPAKPSRLAQSIATQVGSRLATPAETRLPAGAAQPLMEFIESREAVKPAVDSTSVPAAAQKLPASAPVAPVAPALMDEIRAMKGLLQEQMASLSWNDTVRSRPLRAEQLRMLLLAGFSPVIARKLVERLPDDFNGEAAQKWLVSVLGKNIQGNAGKPDLIEQGGVVALVGPTGVGKTTTAAKLAAQCVMKYGASKLGLVTMDGYRIGAQDQLRIYGRILGVPVMVAQDATELEQVLSALSGKHLVLIDTTGMGQRDERVAEQHRMLASSTVRRMLCVNATSQAETLEEVARAYQPAGASPLAGAILTKVDEAARLGGALDVVIRHKLALNYVTCGQRVPEDIHPANPQALAHRALKCATGADRSLFAMNEEEAGLMLAASAGVQAAAAGRLNA